MISSCAAVGTHIPNRRHATPGGTGSASLRHRDKFHIVDKRKIRLVKVAWMWLPSSATTASYRRWRRLRRQFFPGFLRRSCIGQRRRNEVLRVVGRRDEIQLGDSGQGCRR